MLTIVVHHYHIYSVYYLYFMNTGLSWGPIALFLDMFTRGGNGLLFMEFLCFFFLWQLSVCMECTEGITSLPFFKQRRFLCLFSTHSMNTRKRYTILLRSHCHIGIVAIHQSLCISLSLCRIMKPRIAKLFCFHTPLLACVR